MEERTVEVSASRYEQLVKLEGLVEAAYRMRKADKYFRGEDVDRVFGWEISDDDVD